MADLSNMGEPLWLQALKDYEKMQKAKKAQYEMVALEKLSMLLAGKNAITSQVQYYEVPDKAAYTVVQDGKVLGEITKLQVQEYAEKIKIETDAWKSDPKPWLGYGKNADVSLPKSQPTSGTAYSYKYTYGSTSSKPARVIKSLDDMYSAPLDCGRRAAWEAAHGLGAAEVNKLSTPEVVYWYEKHAFTPTYIAHKSAMDAYNKLLDENKPVQGSSEAPDLKHNDSDLEDLDSPFTVAAFQEKFKKA